MFYSGWEQLAQLSLETHSPDKSQLFQGLEISLRPLALTQPEQEHARSVSERRPLRSSCLLSLPHESGSGNRFSTPAWLHEYNADRKMSLNTFCYSTFYSNFHNTVPGSSQKQMYFPATPGHNDHYNLQCATASGEINYGKKPSDKGLPSRSWNRFSWSESEIFLAVCPVILGTPLGLTEKGYWWELCQQVSSEAQLNHICFELKGWQGFQAWFSPWENSLLASSMVMLDTVTITLGATLEIFPIFVGTREHTPFPQGIVLPRYPQRSAWHTQMGRPKRNWYTSGARDLKEISWNVKESNTKFRQLSSTLYFQRIWILKGNAGFTKW